MSRPAILPRTPSQPEAVGRDRGTQLGLAALPVEGRSVSRLYEAGLVGEYHGLDAVS